MKSAIKILGISLVLVFGSKACSQSEYEDIAYSYGYEKQCEAERALIRDGVEPTAKNIVCWLRAKYH